MLTLAALNQMSSEDFTHSLSEIFEHSPWVAAGAADGRPFASVADLHGAMVGVVARAGEVKQRALLCAHPELAGREALTAASTAEQGSKGLDRLSSADSAALAAGNAAYRARFGFPFIIAVRGQKDITMILLALDQRLKTDREKELAIALNEVAKIARFRLDDLLDGKD